MTRAAPDACRRRTRRRSRWLAAVGAAMLLVGFCHHGCAGWVAHALVQAPNSGRAVSDVALSPPPQVTQAIAITLNEPAARLAAWIIEPPADATQPVQGVRGTVLVLHGLRDSKKTQVGAGQMFADAGYRAVLVDLRGHGESSGDWLTYGALESRDLSQALDDLHSRGLLAEPVGVFGSSYGGSTGIQLAAIDRRIKAVVAIAPFASVRESIRRYADHWRIGWLLSDRTIDEGFSRAGTLAGIDLRQADPVAAAGKTSAALLLIHGDGDDRIPAEHSHRLAAAASGRSKVVIIEGEGHDSIMQDRHGVIQREALAWFQRHLIDRDAHALQCVGVR